MEKFFRPFRQCPQEIHHSRHAGKAKRPSKHRPVIVKPFPAQGEKHQYDCQRVQKHQYRHRISNDRIQSQVGRQKRECSKAHRPGPVSRPARKHCAKGLTAAGRQSNRCFQTGHRHQYSQDQHPGAAKIIIRDLRQRLSSVWSRLKLPSALGSHKRHQQIDHRHEK